MTVRGVLLAGAILASLPVPAAAACHRYAVWKYPQPQRCGQQNGKKLVSVRKFVLPVHGPSGPDIPLPVLTRSDCEGGEADELTRARLELIGYAHAH